MTKKSVDLSGFENPNLEIFELPDEISRHTKGIAGRSFS